MSLDHLDKRITEIEAVTEIEDRSRKSYDYLFGRKVLALRDGLRKQTIDALEEMRLPDDRR